MSFVVIISYQFEQGKKKHKEMSTKDKEIVHVRCGH